MGTVVRLREPIIGVPSSEESLTIITVPRDASIEMVGEIQKSGLVEAVWNGRRIFVFLKDLQSRGDPQIKASQLPACGKP